MAAQEEQAKKHDYNQGQVGKDRRDCASYAEYAFLGNIQTLEYKWVPYSADLRMR